MKTIEYRTQDKSKWPRGEWDDEPDKIQWQDGETGYPCLIHRNPGIGNLCGYVGLSPGHPFYEKAYSEGPEDHAHGGLTYSDFCQDVKCEEEGVCHVVEEGEEEKIWWLGFDCHHCWDFAPGMSAYSSPDQTYKNVAYVKAECAQLAKDLKVKG